MRDRPAGRPPLRTETVCWHCYSKWLFCCMPEGRGGSALHKKGQSDPHPIHHFLCMVIWMLWTQIQSFYDVLQSGSFRFDINAFCALCWLTETSIRLSKVCDINRRSEFFIVIIIRPTIVIHILTMDQQLLNAPYF